MTNLEKITVIQSLIEVMIEKDDLTDSQHMAIVEVSNLIFTLEESL